MGGNLPVHHVVSLPVWQAIISASIIPANTVIDHAPGAFYCVCRFAFGELYRKPRADREQEKSSTIE